MNTLYIQQLRKKRTRRRRREEQIFKKEKKKHTNDWIKCVKAESKHSSRRKLYNLKNQNNLLTHSHPILFDYRTYYITSHLFLGFIQVFVYYQVWQYN